MYLTRAARAWSIVGCVVFAIGIFALAIPGFRAAVFFEDPTGWMRGGVGIVLMLIGAAMVFRGDPIDRRSLPDD